jgi:uncharacterized protein
MFDRCVWLNEPRDWHLEAGVLNVSTERETDFWRETHYGFTRNNGHFFNCETNGDFTAELRVQAQYDELYDQAGIMVRIDDAHWVKAGIEMSDGKALLSSVLTVGQSDWATGVYGRAVLTSESIRAGAQNVAAELASMHPMNEAIAEIISIAGK